MVQNSKMETWEIFRLEAVILKPKQNNLTTRCNQEKMK
jgi:hypothetical protein